MNRIFIGKPLHWLLLALFLAALWWMGREQLQTRDYTLFLIVLIAMTTAFVLTVLLGYRAGDRITREPFDNARRNDTG